MSTYTLAVDRMTLTDLRRVVSAAVGGDATDTKWWQPLPGGLWKAQSLDPEDMDAFDFKPTAEVHFQVRADTADEAEAVVGKAVIAVLRATDGDAWLGLEGTETLRRTHGQTTKASRSMWGDLADTLNQGLSAA